MMSCSTVCTVQNEHLNSRLCYHVSTCNAIHQLAVLNVPIMPYSLNSHVQP